MDYGCVDYYYYYLIKFIVHTEPQSYDRPLFVDLRPIAILQSLIPISS